MWSFQFWFWFCLHLGCTLTKKVGHKSQESIPIRWSGVEYWAGPALNHLVSILNYTVLGLDPRHWNSIVNRECKTRQIWLSGELYLLRVSVIVILHHFTVKHPFLFPFLFSFFALALQSQFHFLMLPSAFLVFQNPLMAGGALLEAVSEIAASEKPLPSLRSLTLSKPVDTLQPRAHRRFSCCLRPLWKPCPFPLSLAELTNILQSWVAAGSVR